MEQRLSIALLATAAAIAGCDRDTDNIAEDAEMPPPSVVIANDQRAAEVVGPDAESAEGLSNADNAAADGGNEQ